MSNTPANRRGCQLPDWLLRILRTIGVLVFSMGVAELGAEEVQAPLGVRTLSRQLRVDVFWNHAPAGMFFEIQRATRPEGPFTPLPRQLPGIPIYSDFIGDAGGDYFYQVRHARTNRYGEFVAASDWSETVKGSPQPLDAETLLTEVQEASVRYFYDFGHPISGLAHEGTTFPPDFCALGASGMGLFNLAVAAERSFITRQQAAERVLKMLRFLSNQAERFHGAFPHFLDGRTGKAIPFFKGDDGADLVETSFLMQGALFVREYFNREDAIEFEIRERAEALWRGVEWDWFAQEKAGMAALLWHWSPTQGWRHGLRITGFNECHIVYLLALASPTHPISDQYYWQGWESRHFGEPRTRFGIALELGHDFGPPLFWTHYSYLGLDPRQVFYQGRSFFEHFQDLCRVQVRYAESRRKDFKGYGPLWGITASKGPDGYRAFAPGSRDHGTLAPTAALSSMPYVPEESRACLAELYQKLGVKIWGPFGFTDAFNQSRDWFTPHYLGIDVGPIAPMIENYRSGLCWKYFMQTPEIQRGIDAVRTRPTPPAEAATNQVAEKPQESKAQ